MQPDNKIKRYRIQALQAESSAITEQPVVGCWQIQVLCVTDYFLPGYLGGGPITTISNMRRQLAGDVSMSIFTRDRDLGEDRTYPGIQINRWTETSDGLVYYTDPKGFGVKRFLQANKKCKFDVVYLNSFFSLYASILPYLALCLRKSPRRVLIAPRGEFSPGALSIKKSKKQCFLIFARALKLYRNVLWHASSMLEANDIARAFPDAVNRIIIAADPVLFESGDLGLRRSRRQKSPLQIVFISRISPMKNLDGLIRILQGISLPVQLDVYGPIEDKAYWAQCVELIKNLPNNIQVKHQGAIHPQSVSSIFSKYDLFAFPTHGENFGHVIFEALRAGTPVLVSDQTPWQQDETGALTVIPLNDVPTWRLAIEKAANRTDEQQKQISEAARNYAIQYAEAVDTKKQNLELFSKVLSYPMK